MYSILLDQMIRFDHYQFFDKRIRKNLQKKNDNKMDYFLIIMKK